MWYLSGGIALLEELSWLDMVQGILTRRGIVQQLKKNLHFPWEQYHALLISSLHLYSWGRKVLWIFNSSAMLRTQDRINIVYVFASIKTCFDFGGTFSTFFKIYFGLFNNGRGLTSFQSSQRISSSFNEIQLGFIYTFWISFFFYQ